MREHPHHLCCVVHHREEPLMDNPVGYDTYLDLQMIHRCKAYIGWIVYIYIYLICYGSPPVLNKGSDPNVPRSCTAACFQGTCFARLTTIKPRLHGNRKEKGDHLMYGAGSHEYASS